MRFNLPKVPEVPKIDPALANKITEVINNVSTKIIEGIPPGEAVEDTIKDQIKEAVMREVEPMLEGNTLLIKAAEKLVEKGIDKTWEGIKVKLKEPQLSEEITEESLSFTGAKFCPRCGNKVEVSWNICQNCGAELDLSLYQEPETIQQPEVKQQPVVPPKSIEPSYTPPIAQPLTQDKETVSDPYSLCEYYNPLPSGASCEHYDERTYDCDYYGVEFCPLNKQIAKFRAKKKYLITVLKKKVERRAFKPNEYYDNVFEREFSKKV